MAHASPNGASPNAHLLIGEMPAPRLFEQRWWEGTSLSLAGHAMLFGLLFYGATHVSQVVQTADTATERLKLVFLNRPGPGGGGGGGGDSKSEPPRPEEITLTKPVDVAPAANPADSAAVRELNIPVITVQAGQMLPGAAIALPDTLSPGRGAGPGGGGGRGPGSGAGEGSGLGAGRLGGFGDDAFGPGDGATQPVLVREVKPSYTAQAMQARLQGIVMMAAVVRADGSVDPDSLRITRSLDSVFGLDQQAIDAVKQWQFRPGTFKGKAVPVRVVVELTFTLR